MRPAPGKFMPTACRIGSELFVAGVKGGQRPAAGTRSAQMTQYMISFDEGAMDHIPDEDMADVSKAARAVRQAATDAGVFVFTGGLDYDVESILVDPDG